MVGFTSLQWREPSDHPQDREDAMLMADGIGGRYAVSAPVAVTSFHGEVDPAHLIDIDGKPHFRPILWWPHDEFTFTTFDSVEAAKLAAEADWQKRLADLVSA